MNSLVCRHDCNKDGHQPLTENALNAALEGQTENSDNARGNNPGVLPHPLEDFSHYSDSVTGPEHTRRLYLAPVTREVWPFPLSRRHLHS